MGQIGYGGVRGQLAVSLGGIGVRRCALLFATESDIPRSRKRFILADWGSELTAIGKVEGRRDKVVERRRSREWS